MAEFLRVTARTMLATQDMRTTQYRAVRASADGECQIASNASFGGPSEIVGVLQNKPNSGEHASVGFHGISKIVCGSAVNANRLITIQQSGEAANAGSGDLAFGMALGDGNSGETISALIFQPAQQMIIGSLAAL